MPVVRRSAGVLLMGCSCRQHKWRRLKMAFVPRMWRQVNHGLWTTPKESLATLTALGSLCSSAAVVTGLLLATG